MYNSYIIIIKLFKVSRELTGTLSVLNELIKTK